VSEPVVIVGSGLAGYATARELRRHDRAAPLTLITADDGCSYSKPMLSNALARGLEPADLPVADRERMAGELDAEIRAGVRVEALDPEARTVTLAGGETLRYRDLVLAIGADPAPPPLAGEAAGEVLAVNDLAGYRRLRAALPGARRVLVLGAGLVGCELANDLLGAGHAVTVVEPQARALARLAPAPAARRLEAALAERGLVWRLGERCETLERSGKVLRAGLAGGETVEADLVLGAVGLRPRTALAEAAGLAVGRAIRVDRELRTSARGIWALGDCMELEGLWLPYVMPIMECARALGRSLAGEPAAVRYPVMPVLVKTPAHPLVIALPPPGREGQWRIEELAEGVRGRCLGAGGELLGFVLTGALVGERMALVRECAPTLP